MDNELSVSDLIVHSYNQQPIEFQNTFDAIMNSKIAAAVNSKKLEVAQVMFSDQPPSEDYESDLDQEESTDGEAA
jgi:hypothetical protein